MFETYLKQRGFSHKTIKTRLMIYGQYTEWLTKENLEAEQVTYNDLLSYIKHRQRKGATQRTIQNYMGVIKHYYNHLMEEKKIAINPVADLKIQGVKRKVLYHILEPHELHQIYNSYQDESSKGKRNKTMLGLLVYQGLKTEELAKLEVQHIKLREGKIEVPGGKKSNHRTMQLESHQMMDIYDYTLKVRPEILSQSGEQTQKLFTTLTGKGSTISNMVNSFIKPLKAQNETLLNAKQIRASVITKWLKMYNLREVQVLAGHRYISTTESYQQNDMEGLTEEINQFHPL
jgi:integrase/recombinase XerD